MFDRSSFILMSSQMGSFACYSELNLFRKVLFYQKICTATHSLAEECKIINSQEKSL